MPSLPGRARRGDRGMFQPQDMIESMLAKGDKRDPDFDDLLPNPKDF